MPRGGTAAGCTRVAASTVGSLLLASLCAPHATAAQALADVEIEWETPRSCPPSARVRNEAERLLGAGFARVAPLEVEIEIRETKDGFALEIEIEGEGIEGERALHMPSCEEARDAAALILAVSIDPELARASVQAEPEPEPVDERPQPSTPLVLELAPSIGIDSSLLPSAALLLATELALHVAPFRFALGGALLWPQAIAVREPSPVEVDVGAAAARASVCVLVVSSSQGSLGPCAGLWLGRMWAELEGSGDDRGELLFAPELSVLGELSLHPLFALGLRLSGLMPLKPPRFELRGGGDLHEAPRFSAQAELLLLLRFGVGG